jgi:hypothetical protein
LVWDLPRGIILARSQASFRSIVAALICINKFAYCSLKSSSLSSPQRRHQNREHWGQEFSSPELAAPTNTSLTLAADPVHTLAPTLA